MDCRSSTVLSVSTLSHMASSNTSSASTSCSCVADAQPISSIAARQSETNLFMALLPVLPERQRPAICAYLL